MALYVIIWFWIITYINYNWTLFPTLQSDCDENRKAVDIRGLLSEPPNLIKEEIYWTGNINRCFMRLIINKVSVEHL